tara:strand:- start:2068 stop:2643 length:576 start_codon:yes stop_codon:yes gene_type:complete
MGRAFKGTALPPEPTKLIHSGEYVLTEQKYNSEVTNQTIWTYQFPKKKGATESWLHMSAMFNALEAYSYAPAPCLRAENQTGATKYTGSQYFFGYEQNPGFEQEFNIYSCQNCAHSETLDGNAGNISQGNIGAGNVPIIIRWETNDGGTNRPGHTFCPNRNSGSGSNGDGSNDTRGETIWYGYIRVWEIAY